MESTRSQSQKMGGPVAWVSVHHCIPCGHNLNLEEIDLKSVTSGIITCPHCDWSGPIEIKIVREGSEV